MNTYGLVGKPLAHSFSKKYFTQKFEAEGLVDNRFELFPLDNIRELTALVQKEPSLKGLAVTIPYKESVLPLLNRLDEKAREIGAVNCIRFDNGKLTGFNTDAIGFERSLVPHLTNVHKKALVLGSGGSSKAIQYVLRKLGIYFQVVSRYKNEKRHFILYEEVTPGILQDHLLVVNCTPVGMFPDVYAQPPLPYNGIGQTHLLYDLIYSPAQTKFLTNGVQNGAVVKNGLEMLEIQAEENWKIWNGL